MVVYYCDCAGNFIAIAVLTNITPGVATPISASFTDVGSGIATASVRLDVDQANVTAQATISASGITYARATPYADGEHQIRLLVKDLAGNETISNWSFTVGVAPDLMLPLPANGALIPFNSRPLIRINYASKGPAIDPASLRFYFDAEDVTARATLTPTDPRSGFVSFQPAQPLTSDSHAVYVELATSSGTFGFSEWSFTVDAERIYSVEITAPLAAATVLLPEVEVLTQVLSNRDFPREVTINGLRGRYRSQVQGGVIYGAILPLVAGANTLLVSATFADGSTRTATRSVTYDAPPIVTLTSPRDWEVFGPAVGVNGAPVSGNASNLTGTVDRPITISGTVSKSVTSVNINQQAATLSPDGKSFNFNNFFLREGTSLLSANAIDSTGRIGSANVTVYVDQTAPLLSIENPVNNAVTSSNRIDVRGMVNDAVEGGLGAAEPSVRVLNTANQESVTATVSDRFYFASDLQLEVGANDLTVTSTDQKGNARSKSVRVVRIAVGSKRITLLGGNRQSGAVKSALPQALQISAIDAQGNALANLPVRFDIVRGNGSISLQSGVPVKPNGVDLARNLVVNTDGAGVAKVWMTLGTEASPGGNSVRAWSPEIAEDTVFTATGTRGVPHWVLIDGNASSQFVQANTAPVDALQSAVYDKNFNRMMGAPIRYRILSGEAKFTSISAQNGVVSPDGQSIQVSTDKDGRASVRPIAGNAPGIVKIISEAVLPNNAIAGQALFQLSVLERKSGPTKFRGVVMNHTGKPLAGVRLTISRTNLSATSDANGRFEFASQVPRGKIDLFVDGRTVTPSPNVEYPAMHFETAIIQGQDNQLPHAIYLPPVNLSAARVVGGPEDVTLTIPGYEGFELVVKANSVTFPDGSRTGNLVISPVHNDRLPMVPPGGAATFGTLGWTIQPTGTRFDPPAEVKIPNPGNMKAGQTAQIVQWDHDLATFIPMGYGTVNENASQIITDVGSGITKAGWGGCNGPGCPPDPGFPNCGTNPPPNCRGDQCNGPCGQCRRPASGLTCGVGIQCVPDLAQDNRPCTNGLCALGLCLPIDIQIVSAEIREDKIKVKVTPENVQGGTLKVTLIRDDGEFIALNEASMTGDRDVSFKPLDIPIGNYVRIKAVYTIGTLLVDDEKPYRFNAIGGIRHSVYGPPHEEDCAGASTFAINVTTSPGDQPQCARIAGTIKSLFQRVVEINGHGYSEEYGLIKIEQLNLPGCAPGRRRSPWPERNPRPVRIWRQGEGPTGPGNQSVGIGSVAIAEGRNGLEIGDTILIATPTERLTKSVDDLCGECEDNDFDDGQNGHIDNWSPDIPDCARRTNDFGNYRTFKLID